MNTLDLCERGLVPDVITRLGIRRLIRQRLRDESGPDPESSRRRQRQLIETLRNSPVALHTADANEQHYEVPSAFYRQVLGPRLKYSACYWPPGVETLAEAELAMLAVYVERAGLADGQRILDLGCGWGSISLYLAERFPRARITAVSNSVTQGEFIAEQARENGLTNLNVRTADVNQLDFPPEEAGFDRIISVEMLEHVRNYERIFARMADWLGSDGQVFIHVFCHRELTYPFETEGDDNWMGRHFFTGGLMPSANLFGDFDKDLYIERRWWLDGTHYARTAQAWLANLDTHPGSVRATLAAQRGPADLDRWPQRWRMFFMAVSELFGFEQGRQWGIGHYLMKPARDRS